MTRNLAAVPPPDADVARAEQAVGAEEAGLAGEAARLEAAAAQLRARHERLEAAVTAARGAGAAGPDIDAIGARARAGLPALDLRGQQDSALAARRQAVEARRRIAAETRQALAARAAEISQRAAQLDKDEASIRQQEAAARLARDEAARKAREEAERRAREEAERKAREEAARAEPSAKATPLMGMPSRHVPRVRMQAAIELHGETNFYTGFSTDIGDGGVFVATRSAPPIGTEIELSFSLPSGERLTVHGVVRWTRERNARTPDVSPGVGIQFVELPAAAAAAIHRFTAQREPMFFPD